MEHDLQLLPFPSFSAPGPAGGGHHLSLHLVAAPVAPHRGGRAVADAPETRTGGVAGRDNRSCPARSDADIAVDLPGHAGRFRGFALRPGLRGVEAGAATLRGWIWRMVRACA